MVRSLWLGGAGACALALLAIGCPAVADGLCARNVCDDDAGASGDINTPDVVPTDPCIENPTAPECLEEDSAIFVSPGGDDTGGEGSKARPFKTIVKGLSAIDGQRKRIYACTGTYSDEIRLNATHNGVSIFGGLDCSWNPTADRPRIEGSANPIRVEGTLGLAIAGVEVRATDSTDGSSIGMFISGGDTTLSRVRIEAGAGANGSPGTLEPVTQPTPAALAGQPADAGIGAAARIVQCPAGGGTTGGAGGDNGFPGKKGEPDLGGGAGGEGGNCSEGIGKDGNPANPGKNGSGAKVIGTLMPTGWIPASGENGAAGPPGQGGGGGLGRLGGGGGGGGAGGCGGAAGGGGKGGGASIAIAALEARLTLRNSELKTGKAGNGGAGVAGQSGQASGGLGGVQSPGGCQGGNGAAGGSGGAGGGGAGGISVGVLYKGTLEPQIDPATQAAILLGEHGAHGQGASQNDGVDGQSAAMLMAP